MRNFKLLTLFLALSVLAACSSDGGDGMSIEEVTLTTKAPIWDNNNLFISSGAVLSANFSGSSNYEIGICYNTSPNPTVTNQTVYAGSANEGLDFSAGISNVTLSSTYYIRAYVRNSSTGDVKYGNELSISTPSLTTGVVKNISCSGFSLEVTVPAGLSGNEQRGVCLSTSQNPTASNELIADDTFGSGPFNVSVMNSSFQRFVYPNTTYYLRSFVRINGEYYYGNQVSFKTAGYIGGSGGYVFFDKGQLSNGWRYLEAAPSQLYYDVNQTWYFKWNGCNSATFLSGLSNEIGTGAENSVIIKNDCNYTNNAAAMAKYISVNGMSDWFLPSIEELKMLHTLKRENVIPFTDTFYPYLSSSQQSNTTAFALDMSDGSQIAVSKSESKVVWQVRRF